MQDYPFSFDAMPDPINDAAQTHMGIQYVFPYQRLVISNILEGRSQIVILPTGAGKSLCFTLPACMLPGPTLVIFPLLSLISDQFRRLIRNFSGLDSTRLEIQDVPGGLFYAFFLQILAGAEDHDLFANFTRIVRSFQNNLLGNQILFIEIQ